MIKDKIITTTLVLIVSVIISTNVGAKTENEVVVFEKVLSNSEKLIAKRTIKQEKRFNVDYEIFDYILYHVERKADGKSVSLVLWQKRYLKGPLHSIDTVGGIRILDVLVTKNEVFVLYSKDNYKVLFDYLLGPNNIKNENILISQGSPAFGVFVQNGHFALKNKELYINVRFTNGNNQLWKIEKMLPVIVEGKKIPY